MMKRFLCSLIVLECIFGTTNYGDVRGMNNMNKEEYSEDDELISRCGLEFLPSKLSVLVNLTPEEWSESFVSIDKNVSILLRSGKVDIFSHLSRVAVSLSYPKTLKSLCDFCSGSQFDEQSRHTLCNLLTLFGKLAIKLNEPSSDSIFLEFTSLAKDPTKMNHYQDVESHPIEMLAEKLSARYRELPEE